MKLPIPPKWLDRGPVILACSGPSLDVDRLRDCGIPVCAVSTAIRSLFDQDGVWIDYWAVLDPLTEDHGSEGLLALDSPHILKIISDHDQPKRAGMVHRDLKVPYPLSGDIAPDVLVFPFGRNDAPGWLSMNLGLWFLISQGYRDIKIAGCDLTEPNKYHYGERKNPVVKPRWYAFNDAFDSLKYLATDPLLEQLGVTFRSWTPDSRINELMKYEEA